MRLGLLILALISFALNPVRACLCGSEAIGFSGANLGPGASVFTIPAYTLPRGRTVLGMGLRYGNSYEFSKIKMQTLNSRSAHAHSLDGQMNLSLNAVYGLTDQLNVIAVMPYNMRFGLRSTSDGVTYGGGDSVGFGDLSLLLKYRIINSCDKDYQAALIAGIKMPTGETSETDNFGFKLAADEQPGSGSWDPTLGLAFSKVFNKYSLDASALYTLATPGFNNLIVGDRVNVGLALNRRLEKLSRKKILGRDLDVIWTLENFGSWQEKVEYEGIKDGNHGGFLLYLGTGLKLGLDDRVFLNLNVAHPVINALNGEQPAAGLILFSGLNFLI